MDAKEHLEKAEEALTAVETMNPADMTFYANRPGLSTSRNRGSS